jgi:hypothetical protein
MPDGRHVQCPNVLQDLRQRDRNQLEPSQLKDQCIPRESRPSCSNVWTCIRGSPSCQRMSATYRCIEAVSETLFVLQACCALTATRERAAATVGWRRRNQRQQQGCIDCGSGCRLLRSSTQRRLQPPER